MSQHLPPRPRDAGHCRNRGLHRDRRRAAAPTVVPRASRSAGPLSDLQPAAAGPFDGASAAVQIVVSAPRRRTRCCASRGIDGADGQTFGAHLHAGPCVAGDPAAALGHYNTDVARRRRAARDQRGHRGVARLHRRRRRRHRDGIRAVRAAAGARARSSSTRRPPTTTRAPPVPAWPASRWSGDGARPGRRGCSAGCAWGVVARVFMRLLSDDPQLLVVGHAVHPRASRPWPGRASGWSTRPAVAGGRGGGGWRPCPACCSSPGRGACSCPRPRHGHGAARRTGGAGSRRRGRGGAARGPRRATSRRCHSTQVAGLPSWWPRPRRWGGRSGEVVRRWRPRRAAERTVTDAVPGTPRSCPA